MSTCQGCGTEAVVLLITGCIREHIFEAFACANQLARAQSLYADDNLWCSECGPPGQRTRVRLRVTTLNRNDALALDGSRAR